MSGKAETRSKLLWKTGDDLSYGMYWECGAVEFIWHYTKDEAMVLLSGEAYITDEHGEERCLGAGDVAYFSAGTSVNWRIPYHMCKVAFLKEPVARPFVWALKAWRKCRQIAGFSSREAI